ncbi:CotH kinase family protein [Demequina flava]|uniref:CotH kinase family protein n=1 Tax=Demequina flava TaxID=1095025 RepID=UPI000781F238|nr:CotH kinase family protein [Demequina flava]
MNITRTLKITAVTASLAFVAACTTPTSATTTAAGEDDSVQVTQASAVDTPEFWDSSELHEISVEYDQDEYDAMIATYLDTGDKEWITADVTIDGETFEDAGFKLKGNSSLRGTTEQDAESPQDLPWIINLDKFVDGQDLDGAEEFVIRSNTSETSLNEAVALDLLDETGLAAEEAVASTFSANGSDESVRLVVENPNNDWMERELGEGYLWKAESGGTWDYVGEEGADYVDSFDQEGGDDNYEALIDFLDFINNADDETFAAELPSWLDVDSFATYLAFQDAVDNFDDIEGPGNNGYLYWDIDDEQMTVVNWDLNLAFGAVNNDGGGGGVGDIGGERPGAAPGAGTADGVEADAGELPAGRVGGSPGQAAADGERPGNVDPEALPGGVPPEGAAPGELPADGADLTADGELPVPGERVPGAQTDAAAGAAGAGGMQGSNILAERFREIDEYAALIESGVARLQTELFESGLAQESLDSWTDLLIKSSADIIDTATIESESADLSERFPA